MSFQREMDLAIKSKNLYFLGDALPPDWYAGFKIWLQWAIEGNAKAQFNVGRCYSTGEGVEQDFEQAQGWYEKAAVQGDIRAIFNLYLHFREDVIDTALAQHYLNQALELNEPRAVQLKAQEIAADEAKRENDLRLQREADEKTERERQEQEIKRLKQIETDIWVNESAPLREHILHAWDNVKERQKLIQKALSEKEKHPWVECAQIADKMVSTTIISGKKGDPESSAVGNTGEYVTITKHYYYGHVTLTNNTDFAANLRVSTLTKYLGPRATVVFEGLHDIEGITSISICALAVKGIGDGTLNFTLDIPIPKDDYGDSAEEHNLNLHIKASERRQSTRPAATTTTDSSSAPVALATTPSSASNTSNTPYKAKTTVKPKAPAIVKPADEKSEPKSHFIRNIAISSVLVIALGGGVAFFKSSPNQLHAVLDSSQMNG